MIGMVIAPLVFASRVGNVGQGSGAAVRPISVKSWL